MIDRSIFTRVVRLSSAVAICLLVVIPGFAQNFNFDARRIAMGGVGDQDNAALRLAGDARSYRSIPVPLGLFQVLRKPKVFDPGDDEFNPVRALEYLSNPLHVTFDREESETGEKLIQDLVNGGISRDLNTYRGFVPDSPLVARGLVSPNWGKTFRVYNSGSMYHGVYAGAGPYLTIGTDLRFDQNLVNILSSSSNVYLPNSSFTIDDTTNGQVAMAITGGYRLRLPVPGGASTSDRDGIYVAANYNHLRGLHYENDDLRVRFDTDSAGLMTLAPTTTPLVIRRESSSTGRGFGIDLATALVFNGFDLSFAANGIANRIDWEDFTAEQHVLNNLLLQGSFTETPLPAPTGQRRIELPIRYSGRGAYNAERWTVDAEAGRNLQGKEFRGGAEYRLGVIELRGGGRYSRRIWNPSGGIGFNLLPGFGIDVAAFGTATNIERQRKASLAVSLRFGGGDFNQ
jgi:hypothetical protein